MDHKSRISRILKRNNAYFNKFLSGHRSHSGVSNGYKFIKGSVPEDIVTAGTRTQGKRRLLLLLLSHQKEGLQNRTMNIKARKELSWAFSFLLIFSQFLPMPSYQKAGRQGILGKNTTYKAQNRTGKKRDYV